MDGVARFIGACCPNNVSSSVTAQGQHKAFNNLAPRGVRKTNLLDVPLVKVHGPRGQGDANLFVHPYLYFLHIL